MPSQIGAGCPGIGIGVGPQGASGAPDPPPPPPAAAPTGLMAVAQSFERIDLAWVPPGDTETSQVIERSDVAAVGPFVQIDQVGPLVTSYIDTGLTSSTQYWYRVAGKNSGGVGPYSNVADDTTSVGPPSEIFADWAQLGWFETFDGVAGDVTVVGSDVSVWHNRFTGPDSIGDYNQGTPSLRPFWDIPSVRSLTTGSIKTEANTSNREFLDGGPAFVNHDFHTGVSAYCGKAHAAANIFYSAQNASFTNCMVEYSSGDVIVEYNNAGQQVVGATGMTSVELDQIHVIILLHELDGSGNRRIAVFAAHTGNGYVLTDYTTGTYAVPTQTPDIMGPVSVAITGTNDQFNIAARVTVGTKDSTVGDGPRFYGYWAAPSVPQDLQDLSEYLVDRYSDGVAAQDPQTIFGAALKFWGESKKQFPLDGSPADDSEVVQLTDHSTNANDAAQALAANRALWKTGSDGEPEWLFDGVNDAYTMGSLISIGAAEDVNVWFLASMTDTSLSNRSILSNQNNTNRIRHQSSPAWSWVWGGAALTFNANSVGFQANNVYSNLRFTNIGTTNEIRRDVSNLDTEAVTDAIFEIDRIGGNNGGGERWPGRIRLAVVVEGAITAQQIADMDAYVAGLTPP